MNSNTQYSIKVNEALERYGAKTCGSLARRVERLKRFTGQTNKKYADEMRLENARMMANQEREERVQRRIREIYDEEKKTAPVFLRRNLRRNLDQEFLNAMDNREEALDASRSRWKKEIQEVEVPMTPSSSYNLRPRKDHGMRLLLRAIENGFVTTKRG
jgi:hypothetical protein